MVDAYRYEKHSDNEITVVKTNDGGVEVSVSAEQAVDSYNSIFECAIKLPVDDARRLRDWLVAAVRVPDTFDEQAAILTLPSGVYEVQGQKFRGPGTVVVTAGKIVGGTAKPVDADQK